MSERRQPWMKWYPADWRADPCLRMCSLAARGLWMELLGFMHEAEPYGYLVIGGRAPTVQQIAALVGVDAKTVAAALAELDGAGVCSRDDDGRIVSRRMVRDKAKADQDRANGKGGGNPKLRARDNGGVNPGVADAVKAEVHAPHKAQKPEAREPSSLRSDGPPAVPSAPMDVRTALFTEGLARLCRITGKPDKAARSLIGRFLRDAREDAALVGRLLFEAEQHPKADAVAWIEGGIAAAMGRGGGRRPAMSDGIGDALRRMAGTPLFQGATVDGMVEEVTP